MVWCVVVPLALLLVLLLELLLVLLLVLLWRHGAPSHTHHVPRPQAGRGGHRGGGGG